MVSILALGLALSAAAAESSIEHAAVDCVVAGRFPRFDARIPEDTRVGRATVHFRPEAANAWYSVAMFGSSRGSITVTSRQNP